MNCIAAIRIGKGLAAASLCLLTLTPVSATWSIIMANSRTKEIAIGSATCLQGFDLRQWLPVVVVGVGAAAAQSSVDQTGANRKYIYDQLKLGTDPNDIITGLAARDPSHQTRQYGIADTRSRSATFTGTQDGRWRGGLIGSFGDTVYAIQGNVLTGEPVILMAQKAILETAGDLPAKLMAGMEAARSMGGDGRCSCGSNPEGCGSPPAHFVRSAYVGFMIDARLGDINGNANANGYAQGNYLMNFNITKGGFADPDPVIQMEGLFDTWRSGLVGRPDGIVSTATLSDDMLPNDGMSVSTMMIQLLDWRGQAITHSMKSLTVRHAADSSQATSIGSIFDLGAGLYSVDLTATIHAGIDRFEIIADDGVRPVTLSPFPTLQVTPEPSSMACLAVAGLGLGLRRKHRVATNRTG